MSTAPDHPAATASMPPWRRRLALLAVCLGTLVGPLDTTVNTAFPVITAAFALAPHAIQWVVIAFVLTQTSLTLVFGRLGDLFGHRRIFAIGLATCAMAHLAVGLAPDYPTLVAMRVLQGLGVGLVVSCGAALATLAYPPDQKQRVLALYVASTSLAMAVGPWLGGVLIAAFDWPAVFIFRSPLALLVWLALPWVLPAPAARPLVAPPGRAGPSGAASATAALAFDWAGAIGLSAVLCAVVLGLAELARPSGRAALGLAGLGAGLL
ncbi:MAG: MFS transporter, partial [Aquabacterium sp.]|nr:MFS transporter [Aquabacterium sp.]